MTWTSNLKKGVDLLAWDWLAPFPPGNSYHGTGVTYDGSRYLYWLIQYGSTGGNSTAQLWRYDTWSDGWQYLATTANANSGADIIYDNVRNVLWYTVQGTAWYGYNLNTTSITVSNVTLSPYTIATMTPVLTGGTGIGGAIQYISDTSISEPFDSGTLTSGSTTTTLYDTTTPLFHSGFAGLHLKLTSGTASGERRTIQSAGSDGSSVVVAPAFGSAPASGDAFTIEYPAGTASAGASSTLTDSSQSWITNSYANWDVQITGGTGSGQRRRIASNTATTLTLASATTGNTRTGNFATAPDATSTYKIVPSTDFLYVLRGGTTTDLYRIDLNTGANAASWTALTAVPATVAGGGTLLWGRNTAPGSLYIMRGNATRDLYRYDIGTNAHTTLTTTSLGSETFTQGSHGALIPDNRMIVMQKDSATRLVVYRLNDLGSEPIGTQPYAAGAGYEGHRMIYVKSPDGVKWLYVMRPGGMEFFRVALEHLS